MTLAHPKLGQNISNELWLLGKQQALTPISGQIQPKEAISTKRPHFKLWTELFKNVL